MTLLAIKMSEEREGCESVIIALSYYGEVERESRTRSQENKTGLVETDCQ